MMKTTTLTGGLEIAATKLDGTTEPVQIRQLPIKLYPKYLAVQEDEPKMIELLCDKPPGWAETLAPESFEQIVIQGEEINSDFFSRWVQRRLARQERLLPGVTQQLVKNAASPSTTS